MDCTNRVTVVVCVNSSEADCGFPFRGLADRTAATQDRIVVAKMTFVDRSNTNWTPFPRLAGVPQRVQVATGVLAIAAGAAGMMYLKTKLSAPLPSTMSKEWKDATKELGNAKEREAAGPVVLNPISRSIEKQ